MPSYKHVNDLEKVWYHFCSKRKSENTFKYKYLHPKPRHIYAILSTGSYTRNLAKKGMFCYFFWSYHFLPKLANLLHGYIRHIRDIMQHYEWRRQKTKVVQSAGLKRRSGAGAIQVTL